jgi:hypothetical protein
MHHAQQPHPIPIHNYYTYFSLYYCDATIFLRCIVSVGLILLACLLLKFLRYNFG